jgi:hypothetical protein
LKAEIEAGLQVLIGLPLIGSHRAADMECFSFGEEVVPWSRRGRTGLKSRYGLHVQCPWRIVRSGAIVTGYGDIGEPNSTVGDAPDFDPNEVGQTLREELLEAFYLERRGVEATDLGDLRVLLDGDCTLEMFPDMSTSAAAFTSTVPTAEHWRFLDAFGEHLVVGREGIDIQPPLEHPP